MNDQNNQTTDPMSTPAPVTVDPTVNTGVQIPTVSDPMMPVAPVMPEPVMEQPVVVETPASAPVGATAGEPVVTETPVTPPTETPAV